MFVTIFEFHDKNCQIKRSLAFLALNSFRKNGTDINISARIPQMGSSCGCVSFHGVFVYIRVLTMLSLISNNNVVLSIINFECFKNTNLIAVLFLSKKNSLEKQTQRESFICWFILQMPFKPELGLG